MCTSMTPGRGHFTYTPDLPLGRRVSELGGNGEKQMTLPHFKVYGRRLPERWVRGPGVKGLPLL